MCHRVNHMTVIAVFWYEDKLETRNGIYHPSSTLLRNTYESINISDDINRNVGVLLRSGKKFLRQKLDIIFRSLHLLSELAHWFCSVLYKNSKYPLSFLHKASRLFAVEIKCKCRWKSGDTRSPIGQFLEMPIGIYYTNCPSSVM